ncbi:hypothetical protein [Aggregatilinea lenta]|uniref:hypothetical protein n=1 Tax=Aggregatilinea lenta TaxID=913108 RepID=UPI000E5A4743|nr:hypothetical protein [Aggregatilinea lenta]
MAAPRPVIALAGVPAPWIDRAAAILAGGGYGVLRCDDPATYIPQLIDTFVALILAGADGDGCTWIARAKTEQGTRRIPVLAVVTDAPEDAQALQAGADACVCP